LEDLAVNLSSDHRLLAVLAHPDDESFGPGGTLALYAQRGASVHLICATRGEVGDVPAGMMKDHKDIADLRASELRCAAEHLGLKAVYFLDYRDSGMPGTSENDHPRALARAPKEEVVRKITRLMRQIRPQVVITFDPIGGYRHPDHIAIYEATLESFHAAGNPNFNANGLEPYQPQKLYYHTFPRRVMRWAVRLMPLLGQDPRRWGRNNDIDLLDIAQQSFPIHTRIDTRPVIKAKQKASACHASQAGPQAGGVLGRLLQLSEGREQFMRGYPPAPRRLRERDLFEGIVVQDPS
jgi:mycothiol S-conjugate amidase